MPVNKHGKSTGSRRENDNARHTLFLEAGPEMTPKYLAGIRTSTIWQVVPSCLASLLCLSFGMMLGWPCPTYPKLLSKTSPIPLSLDQTAMIAGFLMLGNIFSTPFSTWKYPGSKYGILISLLLMSIGWTVMWQARSMYWLLGSRMLVGIGNGFGLGQLKTYIKELCQPKIAALITKLLNVFAMLGVGIAFSIGPFISFRLLPLVGTIISIAVFFVCALLPHTPADYLRMGNEKSCRKMLSLTRPYNVEEELSKVSFQVDAVDTSLSIGQILKVGALRKNLFLLGFLVFFQQFSGVPATIIYSQIMFTELGVPWPELCAIAYFAVFFCANVYGAFYVGVYNKKFCLLFSSMCITVCLAANILVVYLELNSLYWEYISFVVMLLYVFFHSVGWGSVPALVLEESFPKDYKVAASHFMVMLFSALALIITKIFQVLFEAFPIYVPFCLFLAVSLLSIVFVLTIFPAAAVLEKKNGNAEFRF